VLCCAVLCCAVLCCVVLCCAVLQVCVQCPEVEGSDKLVGQMLEVEVASLAVRGAILGGWGGGHKGTRRRGREFTRAH